jgi:hypothetical protein
MNLAPIGIEIGMKKVAEKWLGWAVQVIPPRLWRSRYSGCDAGCLLSLTPIIFGCSNMTHLDDYPELLT